MPVFDHRALDISSVDALFLDIGGTVINPRYPVADSYARYANAKGVTLSRAGLDEAFLYAYAAAKKDRLTKTGLAFGKSDEDGRMFWRQVFNPLLPPNIEVDLADSLFNAIYAGFEDPEEWTVFDDAIRLMDKAEELGIPMVVVSNWDTRLPALLDALNLTQRFTGIACSAVLGIEKPSPEIFNYARTLLPENVRDGRILMVGDSHREDIMGAQACGIHTLHVHRGTGTPPYPDMVHAIDVIVP